MTNQKIKERQRRRKGGCYFTRPDRSLNEKKKRSASAKKADTIMQSEQEQPLMIERPLKTADDEPMEVDQIYQDESETALNEDGDQPLDYDID